MHVLCGLGVDGFSECVPDSGFPGMGLVLSIMLVVVVILGSLGVLGFWFCDFGCSGVCWLLELCVGLV